MRYEGSASNICADLGKIAKQQLAEPRPQSANAARPTGATTIGPLGSSSGGTPTEQWALTDTVPYYCSNSLGGFVCLCLGTDSDKAKIAPDSPRLRLKKTGMKSGPLYTNRSAMGRRAAFVRNIVDVFRRALTARPIPIWTLALMYLLTDSQLPELPAGAHFKLARIQWIHCVA